MVRARDSGSRLAALETALRLGNRQKLSRGCHGGNGLGREQKKKILDGEISAADPERVCLLHPRDCSRAQERGGI